MILSVIKLILTPLILAMDFGFEFILMITGSVGWSIVLVALGVTTIAKPFRAWAQSVETKVHIRMGTVNAAVAETTRGMRGERKFREIEKIYKAHHYHPIHNIALGAQRFIMLPILLSAMFLFSSNPDFAGEPFLFINDLSQPDGFAWGLNLMPVIMTSITLVESKIRFGNDYGAIIKFLVIALIMFLLVYGFASAVVVFWTTTNLASMINCIVRKVRSNKTS